jgi:DNA primase
MKTQDQIQALKQISIEDILSNRGIYPTSKSGEWLMYCSPLREDHTASFGVNPKTNTFHDLGSGERGDVIQLVRELDKINFGDACKVLEGFASRREIESEAKTIFSSTCNTSESTVQDFQITAIKDLQHPALIRYVEKRGISFKTAYRYLREIHYSKPSGK